MPRKNKTEVPRGYISWSQIDLVERDPEKYVQRYLRGEEDTETEYTAFGIATHAKLAQGKPETCITCYISRKGQKVKLLGYLDGLEDGIQIERKTSTKLWSAKKAREHGQMKLYALIGYKSTGIIPKQELRCYETANMGEMVLTGEERIYPIQYTLTDMLEMEARVWKAHDKIIALVEEELNNIF